MNQLLYELFPFILRHCDIDDLFNLRLVSKKFNNAVSDFKPAELVFDDEFEYLYNWWWTNESIRFNCVLDTSRLFLLTSSIVNLSCLRRLILDGKNQNYKIQLEDLNHLHRLEQLEFNASLIELRPLVGASATESARYETSKLSLRNLKILYIFTSTFRGESKLQYFIFDTPNLESVCLDLDHFVTDQHDFRVVNPLSIKHLNVYSFGNHLSVFKNVVHFEYSGDIYNWNEESEVDILETFPKLNEIHVLKNYSRVLDILLQRTERSNRDPMKVYYGDYQAFSSRDLPELDRIIFCRSLSEQIKNYSILANGLPYNTPEIYYDKLMGLIDEHLDGSFPIDFFTKYNNIQRVYITTDVDESKAIDFLRNCSNLGRLVVTNSNLNKSSFYDQLPSLKPALVALEILDEQSDLNLDFEFLFKLYYLRTLRTNQELPMNVIQQLPKLKRLERVEFRFLKTHFTIDQLQVGKYNLGEKSELGFLKRSAIDSTDLVKWFEYFNGDAGMTTRSKYKRLRVC